METKKQGKDCANYSYPVFLFEEVAAGERNEFFVWY